MPPRRIPTERQKRLGAELRKLRLAAEVSTEFAAGLLGVDRMKISNMEAGVRAISADRVRTLASRYVCTDEDYIAALVAMTDRSERGWWEQYRGTLPPGLLDIAELEWHATRLSTVQSVHVPALLQTEEYARAIFASALPSLSRLDVELGVRHRMDRQQVLSGSHPRPYVGYIHEAALRIQYGGREVTSEQLDHLCAISECDHITVRVVPFECGAFPGAGHAMLFADGIVRQLDTVQLDSANGPVFTHAEAQLAKYRTHLEWMNKHALDSHASRKLIHSLARQL